MSQSNLRPLPDRQLNRLPDRQLNRLTILEMAIHAKHHNSEWETAWFDRKANGLYRDAFAEIVRRVKERNEPFRVTGFEAIGGKPSDTLTIARLSNGELVSLDRRSIDSSTDSGHSGQLDG